ncbi:conserved protein of unknown function [Candidatus Nitrosocosmicus franklandus]|uniref:AAA+ ATPase domain-containing protein n=1 Tax=Candidatus Nitrosocosmicus franklandianus TaxID=1798806 RepID=A0A484IEI3_9ARCH|nr:conserved protein of unknown function [Candidatus Nitrosocosmicus franklandus]
MRLPAKIIKKIRENGSKKETNFQKNLEFYPKRDIPYDTEKGLPLVHVEQNYFNFNDLVASDYVKEKLRNILVENKSVDLLSTYGLKPKQKILLCGPPGTGKTLSSRILSSVLGYPFVYVRFDSVLSSFLGETAKNIRRIFDFIEKENYVVLFDEFDIVAKNRDDKYEHGEIKRVVNNLIQMMDEYEGRSLLIAATNHHKLLDNAVWRRFDEIIYFGLPNAESRALLFHKYLAVVKRDDDYDYLSYVSSTKGFSAFDIVQICQSALKRTILSHRNVVTNADIEWAIKDQTIRKSIVNKSDL